MAASNSLCHDRDVFDRKAAKRWWNIRPDTIGGMMLGVFHSNSSAGWLFICSTRLNHQIAQVVGLEKGWYGSSTLKKEVTTTADRFWKHSESIRFDLLMDQLTWDLLFSTLLLLKVKKGLRIGGVEQKVGFTRDQVGQKVGMRWDEAKGIVPQPILPVLSSDSIGCSWEGDVSIM